MAGTGGVAGKDKCTCGQRNVNTVGQIQMHQQNGNSEIVMEETNRSGEWQEEEALHKNGVEWKCV